MTALVSARVVAGTYRVLPGTILAWAARGVVPYVPYGKQVRFDLSAVQAALRKRDESPPPETRQCGDCGRELPAENFRPKKNKGGRSGVASDCNACHRAYNEGLRRRDAERAGRAYTTRGEAAVERAHEEALRVERRRALEAARRATKAAMTPAQVEAKRKAQVARAVARQKERYNTDPEYHARILAKKIKRKRAHRGVAVSAINREAVAQRDGWMCSICGKRVTRETWSLDHVVPLALGGSHTYGNVTLAHRSCNCRRGTGRLAVQAPLFAMLQV